MERKETTDNPLDHILSDKDKQNISNRPKKIEPHKIIKKNLSGKINKKMILIMLIIIGVSTLVIAQIAMDQKKNNPKEEDENLVGGGKIPDISRFFKSNSKKEINNIEEEIIIPPPLEEKPEPINIVRLQERQVSSNPKPVPIKTTPRIITEEERNARESSLIKSEKNNSSSANSEHPQTNTGEFIPYEQLMAQKASGERNSIKDLAQQSINAITNQAPDFMGQNMQGEKNSFYNRNSGNISFAGIADEYTLITGTTIPAITRGGINSDLPGSVTAEVDENVYDSITGKNLLIPQGTKLVGTYNSNISYGQSGLQVAWTKMIRPDGLIIELGNMPGTDEEGYSSVKGHVNNHPFQYLKALGLISLMSIVNYEFLDFIENVPDALLGNMASANMTATNQWGQEIINRAMDIQPTITIKPGSPINIFVSNEIRLPAVNKPPVTEKFTAN